jgi:hypothetical protein
MAYRVNRVTPHSINLVAGPFAEFLTAHVEYLGLRKNDPQALYEIRTHEDVLVDIAAELAKLELEAVPSAEIPDEEPLEVHVFHAEDGVVTSDGTIPVTSTPDPAALTPVVIPSEPPAPAPLVPGSDEIPS